MFKEKIELGRGIVKCLTTSSDIEISTSNLTSILKDFGLDKNELVDLTLSYEELCEIHSLARELHESVKKFKK